MSVIAVLPMVVAGPASAQAVDPDTASCVASHPIHVVFVGRVTSIVDDEVTFTVSEVRSGKVPGRTIAVRYPSRYNARELHVDHDYLVPLVDVTTGASAVGEPTSFVDTAQMKTCAAGGTRLPDGSPIDTGALARVGPTAATYGAWAAAVVAGMLVLLVVFGRFLDRRSRYRKPIRL
jgi:hypothetical protein